MLVTWIACKFYQTIIRISVTKVKNYNRRILFDREEIQMDIVATHINFFLGLVFFFTPIKELKQFERHKDQCISLNLLPIYESTIVIM